jgi:DNA-binding response OmpR family regulator
MSERTILVVEDDADLRRLLCETLEDEGFRTLGAADAAAARVGLTERPVALVTLDLGLGRDNGFDLAREIRREGDLPIVMVTGRGDVIDRVTGLELGADDYVVKPFEPRELVARVRAVLRRNRSPDHAETEEAPEEICYQFDGMRLLPGRLELLDRSGIRIEATAGEVRLLEVFLRAPRRILTRDAILDRLHGRSGCPYDRSVDYLVARLRKKIERDPAHPELILTVRGLGYLFAAEVDRSGSGWAVTAL